MTPAQTATTRRRIGNHELAFYENNIACALAIIQDAKALLYWTDDPDAIHLISLIIESAATIRRTHIQQMNERKNQ